MTPDPAKLEGLRQLLARDGRVVFKATGAVIARHPEHPPDLLIRFPDGYERCVNEFAHDQLRQAYEIAAAGPPPPLPPLPAPIKRTRSKRDWGPCPF